MVFRMRILKVLVCSALLAFAAGDAYLGKWSSSRSGNGGSISIRFKPEPAVTFTLNGEEVKTKVAKAQQSDSDVTVDYDFEFEGYRLRSSLTGTVKGSQIDGKYKTTSLEDSSTVDEGTFNATTETAKP